jgi:hypothetical protein
VGDFDAESLTKLGDPIVVLDAKGNLLRSWGKGDLLARERRTWKAFIVEPVSRSRKRKFRGAREYGDMALLRTQMRACITFGSSPEGRLFGSTASLCRACRDHRSNPWMITPSEMGYTTNIAESSLVFGTHRPRLGLAQTFPVFLTSAMAR